MSTATKSARKLMGTLSAPIPAVRVYSKTQAHNFEGQTAVSWVIVTPENKVITANTYNGNLGKNFNIGAHNTRDLPADEKAQTKMVKGYTEVPVSAIPSFVSLVG